MLHGGCERVWARWFASGEGLEGLVTRGGRRVEREVMLPSVLSDKGDGAGIQLRTVGTAR